MVLLGALMIVLTLVVVGAVLYIPVLLEQAKEKRIESRICRDIRLAIASLPPAPTEPPGA